MFLVTLFEKYNISLKSNDFFLIAGPCVVENEAITMQIAEFLVATTKALSIPFIFKASYKKANRSKLDSFTGIGDTQALQIIQQVNKKLNVPVITDIHTAQEAALASQYVDVLQIPAFLCRQTELLIAAAETNKIVNIKKGQFLSPEAMQFAVEKIRANGNKQIMLTERGTTFGYHDLVVDFRGIPIMKKNNVPVVLDVTHSLQQPNQTSGVTGGMPEMIETLAKCAIVAGADGLFMETHPEPAKALSDGANMLAMDKMPELLQKLKKIKEALI